MTIRYSRNSTVLEAADITHHVRLEPQPANAEIFLNIAKQCGQNTG